MLDKIFNRKYYKAMEELDFEIHWLTNEYIRINKDIIKCEQGFNEALRNDDDTDGYRITHMKLTHESEKYKLKIDALEHLRTNLICINS